MNCLASLAGRGEKLVEQFFHKAIQDKGAVLLDIALFGEPDGVIDGAHPQVSCGFPACGRILLTLSDFVGNENTFTDTLARRSKVIEHHIEVKEDAKCFDGPSTFGHFAIGTKSVNCGNGPSAWAA